MTKNEALKAAIDGKKVKPMIRGEASHLFFNGHNFVAVWMDGSKDAGLIWDSDNWEIVPEYVSFAEAWKAYEEGKKILPQIWVKDKKDSDYYQKSRTLTEFDSVFMERDIRGKWLILEDE